MKYPTCFAPTTVSQNIVITTNTILSLFLLRQASRFPTTFSNMHKRPTKQVLDPLLGTPSVVMTATTRMAQMPQQYCPNLKGKGWVHEVDAEAGEEEVNKICGRCRRKKALLGSTTLGKHTWLAFKRAVVCPPSLASSSSIKALGTFPSSSPMTRDKMSLPSMFQST